MDKNPLTEIQIKQLAEQMECGRYSNDDAMDIILWLTERKQNYPPIQIFDSTDN